MQTEATTPDKDYVRKMKYGTLNIFDSSNNSPAPNTPSKGVYGNQESTATCDFPRSGLRMVPPLQHTRHPSGRAHIENARGEQQQVQVVNITDDYKDPSKMQQRHTVVKCEPQLHAGNGVRAAMSYTSGQEQPSRSSLATPLGNSRSSQHGRRLNYTRQERFCQAIRDIVMKRARGVTEFYVQLNRGLIGEGGEAPEDPETHVLTLRSCHAQLVFLTSIQVTLLELADILWNMEEYKSRNTDRATDEKELGGLQVTYKVFSAAFGTYAWNPHLAVMKI